MAARHSLRHPLHTLHRTGEAAIYRGLEKRTADLKAEQERRAKAAAAADEEFSAEFLSAARKVFEMIDVDNSGTLTKQEIITAVKENKEVKMFLANCGNENLQYLFVPSRLNHALSVLDKDGDDEIDANEWEDAIAKALQKKLEQRRAMREANAEAFRREIEEFTANFLNAAREAFALIDKDDSGSLSKTEIVRAVREDRPVIDFLRNCGEENLQFLLQPARLEKALAQLDTDNSGEVDIDECTGAASCFYV